MTSSDDLGVAVPEPNPRGRSEDDDSGNLSHRLLFTVIAMLTAAAAVAAVVLLAPDPEDPSGRTVMHHLDVGPPWADVAAVVPLDSERHYSDEELGLYDLIDNIVFYRPYFTRGRTIDDVADRRDQQWNRMQHEASGHERERLVFEFDIESLLLNAYGSLPDDLGEGSRLEGAYYGWLTECVSPAGFPDVITDPDTGYDMPIYEAEVEQLEFQVSKTGFSNDDFYDLRYECALRAASYPSLDPAVRDEMIGRVKRHYLQAVYDALCGGRDGYIVEVPVETEAGGSWDAGGGCGHDASVPDEPAKAPHEFARRDLAFEFWAIRELSSYRWFRAVGILRFLEDYIVDMPARAHFIVPAVELSRLSIANRELVDADAAEDEGVLRFELAVLAGAHEALHYLPDDDRLAEAFFGALAECGRRVGGSDVKFFEFGEDYEYAMESLLFDDNTKLDPGGVDSVFGMSYYDYTELLYECARYAVTYPTLDPEMRDELLAPQRAHFAEVILDRLDDADSPVSEPDRYQAELDDLRTNGW